MEEDIKKTLEAVHERDLDDLPENKEESPKGAILISINKIKDLS